MVQCLWFLRGDLTGAATETIVPDGRMEIVLHLGEPFAEVDHEGVMRRQAHALAAGQLIAPLRIRPSGFSDVVGIRLRPAGARSLLRAPIHGLGNSVTPLALIAPGLVAALFDAVAREVGDSLVYTALPSGQQEASFKAAGVSDSGFAVENLKHDFPQRIIYRRRGSDSLIARIEGPGPNGVKGIDYPMKRASCTAQ